MQNENETCSKKKNSIEMTWKNNEFPTSAKKKSLLSIIYFYTISSLITPLSIEHLQIEYRFYFLYIKKKNKW